MKAIISKSRDEEALEEYMTAYRSVIPPEEPLRCEFHYFESAEACDDMGFEMFVTLNLNRVACALGMYGFLLSQLRSYITMGSHILPQVRLEPRAARAVSFNVKSGA